MTSTRSEISVSDGEYDELLNITASGSVGRKRKRQSRDALYNSHNLDENVDDDSDIFRISDDEKIEADSPARKRPRESATETITDMGGNIVTLTAKNRADKRKHVQFSDGQLFTIEEVKHCGKCGGIKINVGKWTKNRTTTKTTKCSIWNNKTQAFFLHSTFSHRSLAYFIFAFNHPIDK